MDGRAAAHLAATGGALLTETRALVRALPELFRAAYRAPEAEAFRALTSPIEPWPGHALLWAEVSDGSARILDGPPRASGR